MNPTLRWTAEQIRQKLKERQECLVLYDGDNYRDLSMSYAARMEGSYLVSSGAYETLIHLKSQKIERKPDTAKA